MAHAHDLGDGFHRQAVAVGGSNRPVTLGSQAFRSFFQLSFPPRVFLGECRQPVAGFRCLTFWTGDSSIDRLSYSY
jgi:hypothetical protein